MENKIFALFSGFRKVEMSKRIGLIQCSMYPLVLLVYSFDYDVDQDNYAYFKFTMAEQKCIQRKFPSMNMIEKHLWSLGRSLKSLHLDRLEMGLLAALFIYRGKNHPDSVYCLHHVNVMEGYIKYALHRC